MNLDLEIIELARHKSITVQIDEYHLIYGVDDSRYGTPNWHVATYSDLEDGFDGDFHWYTESGTVITKVTHISKTSLKKF